mmetsp:Transcript_30493/g.27012  ORF Transcript_30493/g.27012 Transcript_30493/m.27012 type:complete len:248 (-) Transcript_30493:33-776(-)
MYNDDLEGDYIDTSLDKYDNYEAYLDDHIKDLDLFYLEDIELARNLIALGYQSQGEFLHREEFESRKKEIEEARKLRNSNQPKSLASAGCHIEDSLFLTALAEREEQVRNGRLSTIIFIRHKKEGSNEISGYIDLADRLKNDNFKEYFEKSKMLLPRKTDLSYYNWDTQKCYINDSKNFKVDANSEEGLLFRNTRDRKIINVKPSNFYIEGKLKGKSKDGNETRRIDIETPEYLQVVFFDHVTRRKH